MGRKSNNNYQPSEISKKFTKQESFLVDGFEVSRGDIIKVKGEFGARFKVDCLTTNTQTGAQWVDCFEIIGTVASVYRAFAVDRVKRIPKRGTRSKKVVV